MTAEPVTGETDHQDMGLSVEKKFFDAIRARDKGDQAALRRNAGRTLDQARGVPWFYGLLDNDGYKNDALYFLVATCFTLDKSALVSGSVSHGNLGDNFRLLKEKSSSANIDRRFRLLLDSSLDRNGGGEMQYRLRQSVMLLRSKDIRINWPQLLDDLRHWNHPNRFVQKRWAMSFYGSPPKPIINQQENGNSRPQETKSNVN